MLAGFAGKVAVIGGAASPIGSAIARRLRSEGARLMLGDLDGDGAINVNDVLAILGGWGTPSGDITGDQTTDVNDILLALSLWGGC